MAAPGIGAGDILTACKFIYDICMKYKDAPEQFDEIAEKAAATKNLVLRLQVEADTCGSLVKRAGPRADDEFQGHLDGLRSDLQKLEKLVEKYNKIHDDGPGRRLLWAVWESGNLTEYRRKLGYHEQKLSLWYSALVYGSLRRLETGQEKVLERQEKVLEALDRLPRAKSKAIASALEHKDRRPLIDVLERSGLPPTSIAPNLNLAETYMMVNDEDKCVVKDHVRRSSHLEPTRYDSSGTMPTNTVPPAMFYTSRDRDQGSYVFRAPEQQPRKKPGSDDYDDDFHDLRSSVPQEWAHVRRSKSSRRPKEAKVDELGEGMPAFDIEINAKKTTARRQSSAARPQAWARAAKIRDAVVFQTQEPSDHHSR